MASNAIDLALDLEGLELSDIEVLRVADSMMMPEMGATIACCGPCFGCSSPCSCGCTQCVLCVLQPEDAHFD